MRRSVYVCDLCRSINGSARITIPIRHTLLSSTQCRRPFSHTTQSRFQSTGGSHLAAADLKKQKDDVKQFWGSDWTVLTTSDSTTLMNKAQKLGDAVLHSQSIPSEQEVMKVLELIKYAALQINSAKNGPRITRKSEDTQWQSSHDAGIEGFIAGNGNSSRAKHDTAALLKENLGRKVLSQLAFNIVTHPPVFLSPAVLETYTTIQLSLNKLGSLPQIFDLYAHKPYPQADSSPIKYVNPNPNHPRQAIPKRIADEALDAAIQQKKLTLALDIISSSYAMPAWRRDKFVKKGLPLMGTLALTPAVAYGIARTFAAQSLAVDPALVTTWTTIGILTYLGTVSSLGYISMATYNDQMKRVTWMPGMPLRDRWLREDERAGLDKIAVAWGFGDLSSRGLEEGEDWELLRHWCGTNGMLVDSTELMDGME